jgi:hypothetical protein
MIGMSGIGIGVIEGFFGPEWSWRARRHFCEKMPYYGGRYYIYAPKRDPFLRKNWMANHPEVTWNELKKLSRTCKSSQIAFGVGLSPFELHENWNQNTKSILRDKIKKLEELGLDYLGIFFDDMKGSADLAEKQLDILSFVLSVTKINLLFCPTYYSDDPILDKVFGTRPERYLEKISALPHEVEIFWTGNKVIPKTITSEELIHVAEVLKRKPLLWENYFANDGPRQCKFLKILPFDGRSQATFEASSGWAFNMMNQPILSEIVFAASVQVLKNNLNPLEALNNELSRYPNSEFLKANRMEFAELGLDKMTEEMKSSLKKVLNPEGPSLEVLDWLDEKYVVGPECLTD